MYDACDHSKGLKALESFFFLIPDKPQITCFATQVWLSSNDQEHRNKRFFVCTSFFCKLKYCIVQKRDINLHSLLPNDRTTSYPKLQHFTPLWPAYLIGSQWGASTVYSNNFNYKIWSRCEASHTFVTVCMYLLWVILYYVYWMFTILSKFKLVANLTKSKF